MKEGSRPPLIPSSLASDLWGLFSVFGASRLRTKLFLYSFTFAFVACTAYLAFFSPPNSVASPWFGNLFPSASASPYRSQISSIVSFIFPNSSSPSLEKAAPLLRDPAVNGNRTTAGVGAAVTGVAKKDRTGKAATSPAKKKHGPAQKGAALAPESQRGSGTVLQGNEVTNANQTQKIGNGTAVKGGVGSDEKDAIGAAKKQTGTGNALQEDRVVKANRTEKGGNKVAAKNGEISNNKDATLADKNQTRTEIVVQGIGLTKANQTEKGGSKVAAKNGESSNSKDATLGAKNQTGPGTVLVRNGITNGNRTVKDGNKIAAGDAVVGSDEVVAKNQTGKVASLKINGMDAVGSPKVGDLATGKNQMTSKGNQASPSTQKSSLAATLGANGAAAKNESSMAKVVPGSTNSGIPIAKHELGKASVAARKSSPPAASMAGKREVSAKDKDSKSTTYVSASPSIPGGAKKIDDWINEMKGCNIFLGTWVKDDQYPLYPEGSCPHIDEPFNCYLNGRPDRAYQKLRWQPSGCRIPRLNATDMLERLRGKRLVYVGDSLNRNMWESLVCILRNSIKDKKKVFEASGRQEFRTEGSYSFIFNDYNCSVEFFRSPFLVQEWESPISKGKTKETLRLDIIEKSSPKYKDADVLIFNTGHWWTHEKTSKGKDYYQEGNHIYSELNAVKAFNKALNTWAKWVDNNVNPKKTLVVFRGYSASHFSGGQWNSGGQCDRETEPIKNDKYLSPYPPKMTILETVIKGMKTPVSYLNITRMTDYRKDAHPSIYRKQNLMEEERRSPERYQDCSHWCLPGVPDSWNELLYAQLLIHQHQ